MKLLTDWGFRWAGWRDGQRGEYWVVAQGLLLLGFVLLPVYRPAAIAPLLADIAGWTLAIAIALGVVAALFLGKGLFDLGQSLTPLPYPREDGQLVESGVYGIVRHPIYSGVLFGAIAWAVYTISLSHALAAIALLIFFDAKARREESWLAEKYPNYEAYRQRVKRLIPWLY
ncbi:MAG TPA: isoprenylcysteine carboxylmethyltransferase family protein [Chroococcidiopsis sp.]